MAGFGGGYSYTRGKVVDEVDEKVDVFDGRRWGGLVSIWPPELTPSSVRQGG